MAKVVNVKWETNGHEKGIIGENMSKSNYEKYATMKQQQTLQRARNLQQAISCLRDRQRFASLQRMESAIAFVADLYDRTSQFS